MKKLFALVISLYSFIASAQDGDRRTDKTQLSIATFNCEFLFDGVEPEGGASFPHKGNKDSALAHIHEIAQVIKKVDADIINVCEVEKEGVDILHSEHLEDAGYKLFFIPGKDTWTRQNVAFFTKIDPLNKEIYRTDKKGVHDQYLKKSVSKNYYAKFEVGDMKFALIGIHFLAGTGSKARGEKRMAQSHAIQMLAKSLAKEGYLPIVTGDFNDYDNKVPDVNNDSSITKVLPQIKNYDRKKKGYELYNVASHAPQEKRFTSFWDKNRNDVVDTANGELTAIDHILVPVSYKPKVMEVKYYHDHHPAHVSDHFPVKVIFRMD